MTPFNTIFGKIDVSDNGYNSLSRTSYRLAKMGIELESDSVANTVGAAFAGLQSTQIENDDYSDSDANKNNRNDKNAQATNDPDGAKNKEGFFSDDHLKSAAENTKKYALKVKDFAKSSVNKINEMPENIRDNAIQEQISKARDDPKDFKEMASSAIKGAGKGIALAGLAAINLPLAAAAFVANKKISNHTKIEALREMQNQQTQLDGELEKADRDGDIDKKTDLLIAKRNLDRARAKMKYGISDLHEL